MKPVTTGTLYSLEKFARAVQNGLLADSDGVGRLSDGKNYYAIAVRPSTFSVKQVLDFKCNFTHVVWFKLEEIPKVVYK